MKRYIALVAALLFASGVSAQTDPHAGHDVQVPREPGMAEAVAGHDVQVPREPGMAEAVAGHHGAHGAVPAAADSAPQHETSAATMTGMDHSTHALTNEQAPSDAMQGDELRDPHAYADGYDFSQLPMRHESMAMKYPLFRLERLERTRADDAMATQYEAHVSYGADIDRAVARAEGEVTHGTLVDGSAELLWSHAVAPYWNTVAGLRYDSGEDPDRTWLALGVEGLAPYWFEINSTAYVGERGRSALNVEAEYEMLFTQRLVLQPRIEAMAYGQRDTERALGPGLASVTAGLRLRYEIVREFAPYVGVEWTGVYGGTAELMRADGGDVRETRVVAGARIWF